MWKNTVQRGLPHIKIRRKRFACWIPKATNTHTDCVLFIPFPLQQWFHERALMLHCTYIASLVQYLHVTYTIVIFHCILLFVLRPGPNERAGQPGSCPRAPTCKGQSNVSEIMGNMVLVISGFHARKYFSKKYSHFGHVLSRTFLSHVRPKSLKNIGLRERQTIRLPGRPHVSGRP
jgi:hypothetical protein